MLNKTDRIPDENWLTNKEVMTYLKFCKFSQRHFLTSRYDYANKRVDDVLSLSRVARYFVHQFWKRQYSAQTCPIVRLWYQDILELTLLKIYSVRNIDLKSNVHLAEIWNVRQRCGQSEWKIDEAMASSTRGSCIFIACASMELALEWFASFKIS